MDSDQFRKAAHAAIDDVISYFDSLPSQRVLPTIAPGYLAPRLPTSAPSHPELWPSIQADIETHIKPGLTNWQSPRFMAFFPATTTYPSILGELYSAAFTAPAFNWLCSPACTELETIVLDWLARAFALPPAFLSTSASGGGGVIQGSASEAIVTVVVAAREKWIRAQLAAEGIDTGSADPAVVLQAEDRAAHLRGSLVALGSEQAHSSTQKAAIIAGVRYRGIHAGADTGYTLTGAAVWAQLQACREAGLRPFYLTVTLGTTATAAVDAFADIAAVKRRWEAEPGNGPLWVHVDAAYAGAALVCEEFQHLVAPADEGGDGIVAFDSFDMNMHKWLLVNFDASLLYVRQRRYLTSALSVTPSYLRNAFSDSGVVTDYRDWQIPLGRRFRALKIWFVLRSYGLEAMKATIRRHVDLGEKFATWVRQRHDLFWVVAGPAFALNVLAIRPPRKRGENINGDVNGDGVLPLPTGKELEKGNEITREVYELINARGEVFITSTVIDGVYAIRVVSANERAEEKYLKIAFDALVSTTNEVLENLHKSQSG